MATPRRTKPKNGEVANAEIVVGEGLKKTNATVMLPDPLVQAALKWAKAYHYFQTNQGTITEGFERGRLKIKAEQELYEAANTYMGIGVEDKP